MASAAAQVSWRARARGRAPPSSQPCDQRGERPDHGEKPKSAPARPLEVPERRFDVCPITARAERAVSPSGTTAVLHDRYTGLAKAVGAPGGITAAAGGDSASAPAGPKAALE